MPHVFSSLIAWCGPHKLYQNIPQMLGVMPDWLISSAVPVVIKQQMQLALFNMYRLSRGIQGMEWGELGTTLLFLISVGYHSEFRVAVLTFYRCLLFLTV